MDRKPSISDEQLPVLQEIVARRRGATMQAPCAEFSQRAGLAVCTVTLRRALVRAGLARIKARQPSAAVVDAQSTRNSPQGGESGFDAGKKGKGRKRHVAVDTLGVLLAVSVTAASVQDRDGAPAALARACAAAPSIPPAPVSAHTACAPRTASRSILRRLTGNHDFV